MWLPITCSRSLQDTQVRVTGQYFSGRQVETFLNMGVTYAVSHDDGSTPVSVDCWNITVNVGARKGDSSFMKRRVIMSGPAALLG